MEKGKLKEKIGMIPDFFKGLLSNISGGVSSLKLEFLKKFSSMPKYSSFYKRIIKILDLERVPIGKRRPMLIGLGGIVLLFIVIIVLLSWKPKKSASSVIADGFSISSEELFTPDEPDFVPEFLLEREPRLSWSLEDIRQYWKVPYDSGNWKAEIKLTVDKLMESVQ